MADWQQSIEQVLNKTDYSPNTYSVTGVCTDTTIYVGDGSAWSLGLPKLKIYDFPYEKIDGSVPRVSFNEFE